MMLAATIIELRHTQKAGGQNSSLDYSEYKANTQSDGWPAL
jgi:hypothetical protein